MNNWTYLVAAVVTEVIGTSALKASAGLSRRWPTVVVLLGYGAAFYFLSLAFRTVPIGIAYAVWSGLGVALIALVGWLAYGERLDTAGLVGIVLILAGVLVLNLFSKSGGH